MSFPTIVSCFTLFLGLVSIVLASLRLRGQAWRARSRSGGREWGPPAQLWLGIAFIIGSIRQLTTPPHNLALTEDLLGMAAALISLVLSVRALRRR